MVLVAQQSEGETVALTERSVLLRWIGTDPDDVISGTTEPVVGVAKIARLDRSARCHGLGVEKYNGRTPCVVAQSGRPTRVVGQLVGWGSVSDVESHGASLM